MVCAVQEQAIRTNYMKHKTEKASNYHFVECMTRKVKQYLMSEYEKLSQKEYQRKHDNIVRIVHWKLCGKYNLKRSKEWYEHAPEGVAENEEVKIL